jgi:hypothetical protein
VRRRLPRDNAIGCGALLNIGESRGEMGLQGLPEGGLHRLLYFAMPFRRPIMLFELYLSVFITFPNLSNPRRGLAQGFARNNLETYL